MEGIFDVIISNLFLIIIIISGLVGLFGNKEKEKKKQAERRQKTGRQQQREKPVQSSRSESNPRSERFERIDKESLNNRTTKERNMPDYVASSVQENQQQQMTQRDEKYGGQTISEFDTSGIHPSLVDGMSLDKKDEFAEEKKELRNELKKSLRKKGLINGIIMAEVLGKPRAIKPFKSVIRDREIK